MMATLGAREPTKLLKLTRDGCGIAPSGVIGGAGDSNSMLKFTLQASRIQSGPQARGPAIILLQIAQFPIKRAKSHTPE